MLYQKHGGVRSMRRMELINRVSARKQPLDRSARVLVRKTMLIPLRSSWNAPEELMKEETLPGIQQL
jgi:hypothetical protein